MELEAKKRFLITFIYLAVIGAITIIVCRFLFFSMFPFLLSIIVAALSQRPADLLSRKFKIKKSGCALFLAATIYLGVLALLIFAAYRLIISSAGLIEYLPEIFSIIGNWATKIEKIFSEYMPKDYSLSLTSLLENVFKNLTVTLTDLIKNAITSAPSLLLSSVVALVASCYIAKDFDGLARFVKSLLNEKLYTRFF